MINVAIISRRLREGKTYEDFRKAWFHTTGFGVSPGGNKMYTVINAFDPREIIVIGFTEASVASLEEGLKIDISFRLDHSLDDVIEPEIVRKFGILISEDDFSSAGAIEYKPPGIGGKKTNLEEFFRNLAEVAKLYARASGEREKARAAQKND
jgi:hypothetical protein